MDVAHTPAYATDHALAARRILIVDDSLPMRVFTQRLLELSGAEVDCAESGMQALRRAALATYDLMLIDIEMPDISGRDVVRTLRSAGDRTPIAAVTAHHSQAEHDLCLASGFDACLTKPFSKATLLTVITPLIQGAKSLDSTPPRA